VKMLLNQESVITEEYQDLIRQFAKFDENDEPIIITDGNRSVYDITDKESFKVEYDLLMNEVFIIEENEERKEMMLLVKDIILNSEETFKGREALEYDKWC